MDESGVVTQGGALAPGSSAPAGSGDAANLGSDVSQSQGSTNDQQLQQMIPAADFQRFQSTADRRYSELQKQFQQMQSQWQSQQQQATLQQQFESVAQGYYDRYLQQGMPQAEAQRWAEHYAEQEVTRTSEVEQLRQRVQTYEQQQQKQATIQSLDDFDAQLQSHYGLTAEQIAQATGHIRYANNPTFQHQVHTAIQQYLQRAQQQQQGNVDLRNNTRFAQPGSSVPANTGFSKPPGMRRGTPEYEEYLKDSRKQARDSR